MTQTAHALPHQIGNGEAARYRSVFERVSIFQDLGPAGLDAILERATVVRRRAGAILAQRDEAAGALYILAEGRAKVTVSGENGREVTLTVLRPGDVFGEVGIIDGGPRTADVVALDAVVVVTIERDVFLAHVRARPQIAIRMLQTMAKRLRRADEAIAGLALMDVEERLRRTLISLAKDDGDPVTDGLQVRRRPTQQELANMIGSCRETVSRTLAELSRKGLVVPRGRGLFLAAPFVAGDASA
jgi:CRP-like cAMP-binding protein